MKGCDALVRKKCLVCKQLMIKPRRQKCCSHRCAATLLSEKKGETWRQARSKKGGQQAGRIAQAKRNARYELLVEKLGLIEAMKYTYTKGYAAGHRARRYYEITDRIRQSREEKLRSQEVLM